MAAQPLPRPKPNTRPDISCSPIEVFNRDNPGNQLGALRFLTGCSLKSSHPDFGGLSSLVLSEDGKQFTAITDRGNWLSATLATDKNGHLALQDARLMPILDQKGQPLSVTGHQDAEAVTALGGEAFVSVERKHSIYRFDWPLKTLEQHADAKIGIPRYFETLGYNEGLEAMAIAPEHAAHPGALFAVGEMPADESGWLTAAYRQDQRWYRFKIKRSDRYAATDAAFLPNGDFLLLERRFNLLDFLGMRIRRFSAASLNEGAELTGETLLEANTASQIDNMEGLAVSKNAKGQTILTLLSDNNFSGLQRTLLLQFELLD